VRNLFFRLSRFVIVAFFAVVVWCHIISVLLAMCYGHSSIGFVMRSQFFIFVFRGLLYTYVVAYSWKDC
jgi:hypothetical protein